MADGYDYGKIRKFLINVMADLKDFITNDLPRLLITTFRHSIESFESGVERVYKIIEEAIKMSWKGN